jgi:hypothetical protein
MSRFLAGLALCTFMCLLTSSTFAQNKDSAAAELTRSKKLKAKISIKTENSMLRDILKEISGAVQESGAGAIRIKPAPNEGITLTSRFDKEYKDKTLEEILDDLLKEKGWGYYVASAKPGDQDDGAIMLVSKPWRGSQGDAKSEDKKAKKEASTKKEEDKKSMVKKDVKDSPSADEKAAAGHLSIAELYIRTKKYEKAKPVLEDIIKNHPDTKAAVEAKKLMEKLPK